MGSIAVLVATIAMLATATLSALASTAVAAASPTTSGTEHETQNPFRDSTLNADPVHVGRLLGQARAFRSAGDEEGGRLMEKMSERSAATWFGGWNFDIKADIDARVSEAAAKWELPVLVLYNVPGRDCGGYSAGGISAADYRTWIDSVSAAIGSRKAVLILEPDALPSLDCLPEAAQTERLGLISGAVAKFKANNPEVAVYLDAGHPKWQLTSTMAIRLQSANVADARGFSLNVSNYVADAENTSYGDRLSNRLSGKHYVVDTSRNGKSTYLDASGYVWCNPPVRGLGANPGTRDDSHARLDAFLWIKAPGESDGACNGGPAAGQWWPERARELAVNAG